MSLPENLPMERDEAHAFYKALRVEAKSPTAWREAERWLGRNDLFYLLVYILHRPDADHPWLFDRCRMVQREPNGYIDLWSREHYKLQQLTEPTVTPQGWKLHGDLVPGDEIFGSDGQVIKVIALNEIVYDSPAFEIEFDDGTKIQSGAEHLWSVERRCKRRVPGTFSQNGIGKRVYRETVLLKTEEIAAHNHKPDNRLAIPVAAPLVLPTADLPIDPYVLGCWLGDGTSANGDITCGDPELFERIMACGSQIGCDKTPHRNAELHKVDGLAPVLRQHDLKNNKHIPSLYLRASVEQRLELLRGLMDTDGSCNTRGTATFVNTNPVLIDGVMELCHTLGLKPTTGCYHTTCNGEPYTFHQVRFQAYQNFNPFTIPRKASRAKPGDRPHPRRFIVACRAVPSSPMRCIQVSAPNGLYLTSNAMVPTHNSTVITFALTIQDLLNDPELTFGIFSHTRRIAKGFLVQIMRELEMNHELIELYPEILYRNPSKEAPVWAVDEGITVKRKSNAKEPTLSASGLVDSMPTGMHYKVLIFDDVVTRESVATPDQIAKVTDCWSLAQNLGTTEEQGGVVRIIGTRYSLFDTYSEILKRGAAKVRLFPATHNGRFDGTPVFFSQKEWEKRCKTQSRSTVAAQLLQNPLADQSNTFRVHWLKSWEIRPRTLNVYIMVDPSMGRNATSDNTAMCVVGIAAQGSSKYLLDGFCHRMTLSERWNKLRNLYRKWSRMEGVQHVEVGVERYGMQADVDYFHERMMQEKLHFSIMELNWSRDSNQSKEDRVARLEPDFRNGRIFLPSNVSKEGKEMYWSVGDDPEIKGFDEIHFRPSLGLTRSQMNCISNGSSDLVSKPLLCRDADGMSYDLTLALLEEYQSFPVGRLKDLIDALSRLYDMSPTGPSLTSAEMHEDRVYWDA